jgi:HSP20 family protein
VPRDPFATFERMRRDMDELFAGVLERGGPTHRRGFSPRVDVFYEGDPARAVVCAELPGVDISGVRLEIQGRKLLIEGERRARPSEGRVYQQVEIEHGPFRRVVELGADVASERATADYDDGVLRIEVPLEAREPGGRRVPIGPERPADERSAGETAGSDR